MNSSQYPIAADKATAAYIEHEQTMIPSSDIYDTHRMVQESIAGRRMDMRAIVAINDLMACPNCGQETGGAKYCGKCS